MTIERTCRMQRRIRGVNYNHLSEIIEMHGLNTY
jgi:hypothetical protein